MERRCEGERKSEQEEAGLAGRERGCKRNRRKKSEREGEEGRETGKTAP